jgi:hypothetical protein
MSRTLLDDLARTLAEPMPRRRALRLLGGTLAAAVVPGMRPSGTWASTPGTRTCQNVRGQVWTCPVRKYLQCGPTPDNPCIDECTGPGRIPCPSSGGFDCCMDHALDGSVACKNGTCQLTCKGVEKSGSVKLTECGEECCTPQQQCKSGKRVGKCLPGRVCGNTCCPSGQKCAFSGSRRVCCSGKSIVSREIRGRETRFCCPPGTRRAPPFEACCPPGDPDCCEDEVLKYTPNPNDPDDLVALSPYVGRTFCVRGRRRRL